MVGGNPASGVLYLACERGAVAGVCEQSPPLELAILLVAQTE